MGRPPSFDREKVLRKLREPFWKQGYAATSLDDLMKATGLGKGSLYAAFGDKQRLFHEVLASYATWRLATVRAALRNAKGSAIDRLRAFFRGDLDVALGERGCLLANSATELCAHDARVQELARKTFAALEGDLAALLDEAIADGDLPKTTNAPALARLLHAVGQGIELLGKTGVPGRELAAVGKSAALALLGDTAKTATRKKRSPSPPT